MEEEQVEAPAQLALVPSHDAGMLLEGFTLSQGMQERITRLPKSADVYREGSKGLYMAGRARIYWIDTLLDQAKADNEFAVDVLRDAGVPEDQVDRELRHYGDRRRYRSQLVTDSVTDEQQDARADSDAEIAYPAAVLNNPIVREAMRVASLATDPLEQEVVSAQMRRLMQDTERLRSTPKEERIHVAKQMIMTAEGLIVDETPSANGGREWKPNADKPYDSEYEGLFGMEVWFPTEQERHAAYRHYSEDDFRNRGGKCKVK